MEQDVLIYIDDKERLDASVAANSFANKDVKNRAYINTLGAELAMKYLESENIDVSDVKNIHSIKKILEENDIADVMLPNIHIDVRVIFDENLIFIPKSHFELELTPDIYLVFNLSPDKSFVKFLGFFEPKLINKNNQNSQYYFIEKEKLSPASELMNFINTFHGNTDRELPDDDFETAENFIVSMADNDISDDDKKYLIKQLIKNAELRDKFIEFENFETLSYKAVNDPMIEKREVQPVETSLADTLDIAGFDEISSTENTVNEVEATTDTINFDELELPETTYDEPSIEDITFDDVEPSEPVEAKPVVDTISLDNIEPLQTDEIPIEEPAMDTLSLDAIELPQDETFVEETATDMLSLDEIEPLQNEEAPIGEPTVDAISLDAIELPQEETFVEETATDMLSLDGIEPLQNEEAPIGEPTVDAISLDAIELPQEAIPVEAPAIDEISANLTELPQEETPKMPEDDDFMAFDNIDSMEMPFADENQAEKGTLQDMPFETESFASDMDNFAELDDIIGTTSQEQTNNVEENLPSEDDSSFGKNLLENLSAEDEDKIQIEGLENSEHENISSDDLLAQIDNVLGASSTATEPIETDEEISEETLFTNSIDDILDKETGLDVLYNEQTPTMEQPEMPEEIRETEEEIPQIPGAALYNKKSTNGNKKSIFVAGALIAILAAGSAFTFLRPKNDATADIEPLPIKNETPTPVQQGATEDILAANTPQIPVKKDIETPKPVVKELKNNPPKQVKSESFLSVDKLVWDVPDALSYSSKMQNYLRTAGRSIKLSLSTDLLLATEYAYSNQVKVGLKLSQNGSVQDARILSSSGSTQIDNIVLQSVKDTLNVVKPPSDEVKTPDFNLNLIIYF